MKRVAVISPSGKYYGSEQVLYDFLKTTRREYYVFSPRGKFYDILKEEHHSNIHLIVFSNVKLLYFRIFLLLISNSIDAVYVNEGGHSRYIRLLAKLFPQKRFIIHIRLLEDCTQKRIGDIPKNVRLIAVSEYISDEIKKRTGLSSVTIHDVYIPHNQEVLGFKIRRGRPLQLGIVGRLTDTKGIDAIRDFCVYAELNSKPPITINFFGDIDKQSEKVNEFRRISKTFRNINVKFHGYVSGAEKIYPSIDILLHFNNKEPLGRIALEALDYGVPFIGFDAGGIGEIARLTHLTDWMVDPFASQSSQLFLSRIENIQATSSFSHSYANARRLMLEKFSPRIYTQEVEKTIFDK